MTESLWINQMKIQMIIFWDLLMKDCIQKQKKQMFRFRGVNLRSWKAKFLYFVFIKKNTDKIFIQNILLYLI